MTETATPERTALSPGWSSWMWPLLPLACHVGFSWIGFNPTDEGWLQAIARRMLEGEIPHRDFISLRPVLSAALQIPLVWLGGDHVFWLARLWGWLVEGAIAWLWSGLLLPKKSPPWRRELLYAIIFFLNVHVFPVMAWHSLDGLLFATAALKFARGGTANGWKAAFICAGFATLCRQNFVFFVPFLLLGLSSWKQWRMILWTAIPPAAYLLILFYFGALLDFTRQISASHGMLFDAAFGKYIKTPACFWGAGTGLAVAFLFQFFREAHSRFSVLLPSLIRGGTGVFAVFCLWRGTQTSVASAFFFLGLSGTWLVVTLLTIRPIRADIFPLVAAVGLAWVVAISPGYSSPAMMSGALLVAVWRLLEFKNGQTQVVHRNFGLVSALTMVGLSVAFWHARLNYPYLDRSAGELNWDAGEVMRGASGLRTNAVTYKLLKDLRQLTDQFELQKSPYAILTDYSAAWVLSPQRNPLACEWPQENELGRDRSLVARFKRQMCTLPAQTRIIVQRHFLFFAPEGLVPISTASGFYTVQTWLVKHGKLIGQTPYFDIYFPPPWDDSLLEVTK